MRTWNGKGPSQRQSIKEASLWKLTASLIHMNVVRRSLGFSVKVIRGYRSRLTYTAQAAKRTRSQVSSEPSATYGKRKTYQRPGLG